MSKKEHAKEHEACPCGEDAAPVAPGKAEGEDMVSIKNSEVLALQEQAKDYKDKYLRVLAEFENARRRQERDKAEFVKYANEGLIVEFLSVLDDLERSVTTAREKHQDYESFIHGVEIVMKRVYDLLKKQGVEPIESLGKMFDPHSHEILMQSPSPEHEHGTVIQELQKGYRIGDKVLRTSKVAVAMNTSSVAAEERSQDVKEEQNEK